MDQARVMNLGPNPRPSAKGGGPLRLHAGRVAMAWLLLLGCGGSGATAQPVAGASGATAGLGGARDSVGSPAGPSPTGSGGALPAAGSGGSGGTASSPAGKPCTSDTACRAVSDYCTGCDCRALASGENLPACPGPGVRCLVDPCQHKKAACQKGRCVLVDMPTAARAARPSYDPCAGRKCGDACHICPPDDATCMETAEVKQCNAAGKCSGGPPGCGGK